MRKLILLFLSICVFNTYGQNFDLEYQHYLGNDKVYHYFFQYGKRSGLVKPMLVKYELDSNLIFHSRVASQWIEKSNAIEFKKDSLEIFFEKSNDTLAISIDCFKVKNKTSHDFSQPSVALFPNNNFLLIAAHAEAPIYMFDLESFELSLLPLIGGNLRVKGEYFFFEAVRYSNYYTDYPESVFKVHKDDLKNPEEVIINIVENWYPYTENIIYARTLPTVGDCGKIKCQGAFYDINSQKYAIQEDYIPTDKFFTLNNETYLLNIVKENNHEFFKLIGVPPAPSKFPYEIRNDKSQTPRGKIFQWYNIPLKEKQLPNTFITHQLLYDAPESELEKLSLEQLRLLRNTFFAFQGYKFSSADLTDFFIQFDWYKKMIMGDKSNDDIYIWPDEKERIALIREVENRK